MTEIKLGRPIPFQGEMWTPISTSGTDISLLKVGSTTVVTVPASFFSSDPDSLEYGEQSRLSSMSARTGLDPRNYALHLREILTGQRLDGTWPPRPEYDPSVPAGARYAAKREELRAFGIQRSVRTLYRDTTKFLEGGEDALRYQRVVAVQQPTNLIRPALIEAIEHDIRLNSVGSKRTWAKKYADTTDELRRIEGDGGPMPKMTAFRKYYGILDAGARPFTTTKQRRSRAHTPRRVNNPKQVPLQPGALTEMDTTPIDLLIVDDNGNQGVAELAAIIDVATRRVLAVGVRVVGMRATDLSDVLIRANVLPENRPLNYRLKRLLARWRWPEVYDRLDAANAHAHFPTRVKAITVDNGAAFLSQLFTHTAELLGIDIIEAATDSPTDKPHIESFFRVFRTQFSSWFTGYKGNEVANRGANVDKDPLLTVYELRELIELWVAVVYNNRKHAGLTTDLMPGVTYSPNEMHQILQQFTSEPTIPLSAEAYIKAKPVVWNVIGSGGIRVNKRDYDCSELDPYRRMQSPHTRHGGKWPVHWDQDDWAQVWVELPDIGWVTVPCKDSHILEMPFGPETLRAMLLRAKDEGALTDAQVHELMHSLSSAVNKQVKIDRRKQTRGHVAKSEDPIPEAFVAQQAQHEDSGPQFAPARKAEAEVNLWSLPKDPSMSD